MGPREDSGTRPAPSLKQEYLRTDDPGLFRLRFLLDPRFLARRLESARARKDLLPRAGNLLRLLAQRSRKLPAALKATASDLGRRPRSAFEDARLELALLRSRRARRPAAGADGGVVANPLPPEERHPRCRVHLSWNIHIACNYDCGYCWFHGKWEDFAKTNRYRSPAEWRAAWARLNDRYGPVQVDIAGGEPFTYPGFLEILRDLSRTNVCLVSTNFAWAPEPFLSMVDPSRVQIAASFHPEYARDPRPFIARVERLRAAGFSTSVSLVAHPPILPRLLELWDAFLRRGIRLDIQPFRGEWRGRRYPQSYTPTSRRLVEGLIQHGRQPAAPPARNHPDTIPLVLRYQLGRQRVRGMRCNAGVFYARLQSDGSVTRCAQGDHVGDFFDPAFSLAREAQPCPFERCDCVNEMIYVDGGPRGPSNPDYAAAPPLPG